MRSTASKSTAVCFFEMLAATSGLTVLVGGQPQPFSFEPKTKLEYEALPGVWMMRCWRLHRMPRHPRTVGPNIWDCW